MNPRFEEKAVPAADDVNGMIEPSQWMIDWSSGRVRSSEWKMAFELPADQNATPFCLRALLLQSGLRAGGCLNKGSCDRHEPLQKRKGKRCGLQGQEQMPSIGT